MEQDGIGLTLRSSLLGWGGDNASILAVLCVSAAFSAINHGILLGQLWELGMGNMELYFFFSFLHSWSQLVWMRGKIQLVNSPLWNATGLSSLSPPVVLA